MILFMDFEASSLHVESYPIEIGWCDATGAGESYLIRPTRYWHDWSPKSEAIHGLSMERLLDEGLHVETVARKTLAAISRAEAVYSDAPAWDGSWLEKLFTAAAYAKPPKLTPMAKLFSAECQPLIGLLPSPNDRYYSERKQCLVLEARSMVEDIGHAERARARVRHRALPDAQGLQWQCMELRARVAALVGG